jgi:hypothetical protein
MPVISDTTSLTWLTMIAVGLGLLGVSVYRLFFRRRQQSQEDAQWRELEALRARLPPPPAPPSQTARSAPRPAAPAASPVFQAPQPPSSHQARDTQRAIELLDNKIATLQRLLHDADQRIAQLQHLSTAQRSAGRPSSLTDDLSGPFPPSAPAPLSDFPDRPTGSFPPSNPTFQHPPHNPRAPRWPGDSELDIATREVYRLADLGMDAVRIAQQTGQQVGQVELILAIRR